MKRLLLSAVLLSSMGAYAQVGINTDTPQAMLDVEGNFRVKEVTKCTDCEWVLVQGADGVVKKVALSKFTLKEGSTEEGPDTPPSTDETPTVGGTATFAKLLSIEENIVSFKYGEQDNEKIQGEVTATKIPVKIPYEGATAGSVEEKIIELEGNSNLKLKIKSANISAGNGALDAEIYYAGGTYNLPLVTLAEVKQGNIKKATDVTFKIKVKGVTDAATVNVNALGGIPDKKFKTSADHKFIYLPVRVTGTVDGQPYDETWLNFNLGADYANMKKRGIFNPTKVVTSKTDHHAYGSLFQFGRDSDGHELVNWNDQGKGTRAKDVTWYSYNDSRLSYSEEKDPCPAGYRTPNQEELDKLREMLGGNNVWNNDKLKLPVAGIRDYSSGTSFNDTGSNGYYWSSTYNTSNYAWFMYFSSSSSNMNYNNRSYGFSVRCLKNKP